LPKCRSNLVISDLSAYLRDWRNTLRFHRMCGFFLSGPGQEVRTTLNIVSDGALVATDAYLVINCTARGPKKGGIRMSLGVDMHKTGTLAELMTYK